MAKKRDRRDASKSDRGKPQIESAKQLSQSSSDRRLVLIFVVFFIVSPAVSLLVYRIKFSAPPDKLPDSSLHRRGLVKPDITYPQILAENAKVSENGSLRQYTYPVLAYITPWNSRGYEMAKRFNSKFTHLSPVWYDLKSQGTTLVLEGRHNADRDWIADLRVHGDALVLPRVALEAYPKELLRKKKLMDKAINLIVTECREMDYDGIVLESWSRWAAYGILHDPELRIMALKFVEQLGQALHSVSSQRSSKQHLELIYVIGPPRSDQLQPHDFGPGDLQGLSDTVDGFSLMTYDFSGPHSPGPNAPMKWISSVLQLLLGNPRKRALAPKIFLGINFYGNDFILSGVLELLQVLELFMLLLNNTTFLRQPTISIVYEGGGGAITGRDYLSLLEKQKPVLQWEQKSGEHLFFYVDDSNIKHVVFYPSLMSMSLRLEEARISGTGISIWEIGQGLDYFFDLL